MARYDTDGSSALAPEYENDNPQAFRPEAAYGSDIPKKSADIIDINSRRKTNNPAGEDARKLGSAAEESAAKSPSSAGKDALRSELRSGVEGSAHGFKYTGKGIQDAKNLSKATNLKGMVKGKGPIFALGGIMAVVAVAMLGGQSSLPFALLSRVSQEFNSRAVVASKRSNKILDFSTNPKNTKTTLENTIFGNGKKLGKSQSSRLSANGITQTEMTDVVVNGKSGKTIRPLEFTDGNGNKKIVVSDLGSLDADTRAYISLYLDGDLVDLDTALLDDAFRHNYTAGTLTWRGKIANSFNTGVAVVLNKLGLDDRNRFKNWSWGNEKINNLADWADNQVGIYNARGKKMVELVKKSGSSVDTSTGETEVTTVNKVINDDGSVTEVSQTDTLSDGSSKLPNGSDADSPIEVKKEKRARLGDTGAGKIISIASSVATIGLSAKCLWSQYNSQIAATVQGETKYQRSSWATGFSEILSRMMGAGADLSNENVDATDIGNLFVEAVVTPGENGNSAIDSDAAAMVMGGSDINQNSETFAKSNLESNSGDLISGSDYLGCIGIQALAQIGGDIVQLALNFIPGFGQATKLASGAADAASAGKKLINVAKTAGKVVAPIATAATLTAPLWMSAAQSALFTKKAENAISTITNADIASELLVPTTTPQDPSDDDSREHAGNQTILGLVENESALNQMGLPYASAKIVNAATEYKEEYLAELAEYERSTLSPFDISSENTFFGYILYNQILPLSIQNSSLFSSLSNILSVTRSSFASILPSAYASSTETSLSGIGDCPILESVGAVGNKFCSPIFDQDYSTIDIDPADIFELVEIGTDGNNNFETDASGNYITEGDSQNPVISQSSELMKYITNCSVRSLSPGIADQSAAAATSYIDTLAAKVNGGEAISSGASQTLHTFLQYGEMIPVAGDVLALVDDIADAGTKLANADWVSGQYCVASSEKNEKWDEKFKYYAQYLNDQEQFESMGMIDQSAKTSALEIWYEANPLDNSYEGIIARYSGQTKEQVIASYEYIDYINYIASYNPSDRLPELSVPETIALADQIPVEAEIASPSTKIGVSVNLAYAPIFKTLRDQSVASA